jgi:hypothetical protein
LRLLSESELSGQSSSGATPASSRGASRGVNLPASRTGRHTGRPLVIDATYAGAGVGVGSAPGTVCDVRQTAPGAANDWSCATGAAGGVRKRTWWFWPALWSHHSP